VAGPVGRASRLRDGSTWQYYDAPAAAALSVDDWSAEACLYIDSETTSGTTSGDILSRRNTAEGGRGYAMGQLVSSTDANAGVAYRNVWGMTRATSTGTYGLPGIGGLRDIPLDAWESVGVVSDVGQTMKLFNNGSSITPVTAFAGHSVIAQNPADETIALRIGAYNHTPPVTTVGDIRLGEVRISNTVRSEAWMKAYHHNLFDGAADFLDFGKAMTVLADARPPEMRTDAPTDITTSSACFNGYLTSTGTAATVVHVYWGADGDPGQTTEGWDGTNVFAGYAVGEGAYATNMTGLIPGTTYTYRYYASNAVNEAWGAARSFIALQAPAAETPVATSTNWMMARLSGEVTQGVPDPAVYICLNPGSTGGTSGTGNWARVVSAGSFTGAFEQTVSGLAADTLYYGRLYVTNDVQEAWSGELSFRTTDYPTTLTLNSDRFVNSGSAVLTFAETGLTNLAKNAGVFAFADLLATPVTFDMAGYRIDTDNGTAITLDLNGGDLIGNSGVTAFETYRTSGTVNYESAGALSILNVGDIAMGRIDTRISRTLGYTPFLGGAVTLGANAAGQRAGDVRIDTIWTYGMGYMNAGGDVSIFSSGDVRIATAGGVKGDIITKIGNCGFNAEEGKGGDIVVRHNGDFVARLLDATTRGDNWGKPGSVTLIGDLDNTVEPAGALAVNNIYTYNPETSDRYRSNAKPITIAGYTNVTVGNMSCYYGHLSYYSGGNISIARIAGDIKVTGAIDTSAGSAGDVTMATESDSGGSITINGAIDLDATNTNNEGDLSLTSDYRITLGSLNAGLIRNITFSVPEAARKNWHWVKINSEPAGFTVTVDDPQEGDNVNNIVGFHSVNSHVYYRNTNGETGLNGDYDIIVGDTDSGWNLIDLGPAGEPPEKRSGTVVIVR
jgi:hypothetical protein